MLKNTKYSLNIIKCTGNTAKAEECSAVSHGFMDCMGAVESWPELLIEHLGKGLHQHSEHR